jgi:hypothetical protein
MSDKLVEFLGVAREHYEQVSLHKAQGVELAPDWKCYVERELAGQLLYVTLREQGKLVGYCLSFISPSLHYQTCLTCATDIYFVSPGLRPKAPSAALRLFRTVERELRRRGVRYWVATAKLAATPDAGRLLQAFGLQPIETVYAKWLES